MPKTIYINLDEYASDAKPVSGQQLFQQEAMTRIKSLMLRFLKEGRATPGRQHVHNTITINGSRGSGKTMFILSLIEALRSGQELAEDESDLLCIQSLPILDPTLIENKENIVLTVLARIYNECEQKKQVCRRVTDERDDDQEFQKVDKALSKLARGLCLLDGVGKNTYYGEDWSNPDHVVRTGMRQAYNGVVLEDRIHSFVDAALRYLNKEAFLLAFDDIDTQFERGWPVLEAIRKYFTTPRLIVMLSGDMALYSKLVRRTQFQNLGDILLRYDRPSSSFHSCLPSWESDHMVQTVDRLEEQYLMKVLKPENRLSLRMLGQIHRQQASEYVLKVICEKFAPNPAAIDNVLGRIIKNGFHARKEQSLYSQAILDQPARTITQFLVAARDLLADQEGGDTEDQNFAERLTDVFASALYQYGLDPQTINRATPHGLIDQLVTWFGEARVWDTGYRLKPEYADGALNQVAMVLGARCTREANRSLADALNYMLKIVWTHEHVVDRPENVTPDEIVGYLGLRQIEKSSTVTRRSVAVQRSRPSLQKDQQKESQKDLQRELLRGSLTISRAKFTDASSVLQALYVSRGEKPSERFPEECVGETNLKKMNGGIVAWWQQVRQLHKKAQDKREDKKTPYLRYVYNTVASLSIICQNGSKYLRMAVFSIARGANQKSYVSFFALMGAVTDLLGASSDVSRFHDIANRLSQIRTYPAPSWDQSPLSTEGVAETGDDDDSAEEGEGENSDPAVPIADGAEPAEAGMMGAPLDSYVLAWAREAQSFKGIRYSAAFYGRIFTRFYYALGNMDEEFTARDTYVGTVLHRQIIAFLHAVLVEEMLENGRDRYIVGDRRTSKLSKVGPRLDNAVLSDAPFWDNFPFNVSSADGGIDHTGLDFTSLPLFRLLFSCPIFALFVSPTSARVSGGKSEDMNLLEMMAKSWDCWDLEEQGASVAEADSAKQDQAGKVRLTARLKSLEVDCFFSSEKVTFPNLWAPLHSLMVPNKRPLSTAIKVPGELPPDGEGRAHSDQADAQQNSQNRKRERVKVSPDQVKG